MTDVSLGKSIRLRRLFRHGDDCGVLIVPLDHSVTMGPIGTAVGVDRLLRQLEAGGADAVVLHKGRARQADPSCFRRLVLIVHVSASTVHAPDPDAKYLVASVEEAVELGADAISIHVNMGSPHEARQVADLASVAATCHRWGVPLLAMMYARGPNIANPNDPRLVAHVAGLAVDLGADLVKTVYTGAVETMAEVVATCPVPLLVAGGERMATASGVLELARDAMCAGARGVAVGRNVFEADDPAAMVTCLAEVVHAGGELAPKQVVGTWR